MITLDAASAPAPTSGRHAPGSCVAGRYRIVRHVADGGMGRVYEAEDLLLGGRIALKTLFADPVRQPRAVERFRTEIQLARMITHPNVCRVFDAAIDGSSPMLTMELLVGETLADRLDGAGRLSAPEAIAIAVQLAAAIDTAHAAGVIHRDFKCQNVLLVPDGTGGDRAVVTDFGLALLVAGEGSADPVRVTQEGSFVGTPAYMAPEQVEGGPLTAAVDIYAFGVVLYELVTGALPFSGGTALAAAARRLCRSPTPVRTLAPDLPDHWDEVISRCLAFDPADRFPTAGAVVAALSSPPQRPRQARRRAAAFAAIALTSAAVAVAMATGAIVPGGSGASGSAATARQPVIAIVPRAAGDDWQTIALAEMVDRELGALGRIRAVSGDDIADAMRDLGLGTQADAIAHAPALAAYLGADAIGDIDLLDDGAIRLRVAVSGRRPSDAMIDGAGDLVAAAARVADRVRGEFGLDPGATGDAARAWLPAAPVAAERYAQALARRRALDPGEACRLFGEAASAAPTHGLIHLELAVCLDEQGQLARSADELRVASTGANALPARDRALVSAAVQMRSANPARAAELLDELSRSHPDDVEVAVRLSEALSLSGKAHEALSLLATHPRAAEPGLAVAEAAAAMAATDFARQQQAATRAVELARARGANRLEARAEQLRGLALASASRYRDARDALRAASERFEQIGDRDGAAGTASMLATVHISLGEMTAARRVLQTAADWYRRRGARNLLAWTLPPLGYSALAVGDVDAAEAAYQEAAVLGDAIASDPARGYVAAGMADVRLARADLAGAAAQLERARSFAAGAGDPLLQWWIHHVGGGVLRAQGDVAGARRECDIGAKLASSAGLVYSQAVSELCAARIEIETGTPAAGEALARAALARLDRTELTTAASHVTLARALAAQHRWHEARSAVAAGAGTSDDVDTRVVATIAAAEIAAGDPDGRAPRSNAVNELAELRRELAAVGLVRLATELELAASRIEHRVRLAKLSVN